jgi:hypothetical protein
LVSIFFRFGAWRRLIISLGCIIFFMFSDCSKIGNKHLASKSISLFRGLCVITKEMFSSFLELEVRREW